MGSLSGFGWFFNTYLIGYLRISCLTGSFATYFTGSLAGDFAASLTSIWPGSCFTGYLTANLIGSLVASLGVSCLAYLLVIWWAILQLISLHLWETLAWCGHVWMVILLIPSYFIYQLLWQVICLLLSEDLD